MKRKEMNRMGIKGWNVYLHTTEFYRRFLVICREV